MNVNNINNNAYFNDNDLLTNVYINIFLVNS